MKLLPLFLAFLRVGAFSFGGGYGSVPLIRETVLSHGWLGEDVLVDMIAVSESTPGPLMINLATWVGAAQAGLPGAVLATLAVILPCFTVLLLVSAAFGAALKNRWVQAAMRGLRPCVTGLILATGFTLAVGQLFPGLWGDLLPDWRPLLLFALLGAGMLVWKKLRGRRLPPIALILAAAAAGMILFP